MLSKDVQFSSAKFGHLIPKNRWTNGRDMVISLLVDQVLKMTPKPIDWILKPLQQPILRVPLRLQNFKFQAWSCGSACPEFLLYVLQNVTLVYTILHGLLIAMISGITKLQI